MYRCRNKACRSGQRRRRFITESGDLLNLGKGPRSNRNGKARRDGDGHKLRGLITLIQRRLARVPYF